MVILNTLLSDCQCSPTADIKHEQHCPVLFNRISVFMICIYNVFVGKREHMFLIFQAICGFFK